MMSTCTVNAARTNFCKGQRHSLRGFVLFTFMTHPRCDNQRVYVPRSLGAVNWNLHEGEGEAQCFTNDPP